ncbi:MAG: aspartate dehydrogenase domain-containing protein [Candidatus Heimdallarchaeaceae archaeon]
MVFRLGIVGIGYIGLEIIKNLHNFNEKIVLSAVFDVVEEKMEKAKAYFPNVRNMVSLLDFDDCDVIVESASQEIVETIFDKIVQSNKIFVPMSIGAFITNENLYSKYSNLSEKEKKMIRFPSGAIGGFDTINALNFIGIKKSKLTTRKPVAVFKEHTYVQEQGITLSADEKTRIFQGNAKDAAKIFPRSINVGARLALSTLGPYKTEIEIYADPTINKNIHEIEISSEVGEYKFAFQNNPSPTNPRTSWLAALSLLDMIKNI